MSRLHSTILALTIALTALLALRQPAHACTPPPNHRWATVAERTRAADVVVVGEVIAVGERNPMRLDSYTATLQVEQIIKGDLPGDEIPGLPIRITVDGYGDGAMCRSSVSVGRRAIFFVDQRPDGTLTAHYHPQIDATAQATEENIREAMATLSPHGIFLPVAAVWR
jgi:hypothetical protein